MRRELLLAGALLAAAPALAWEPLGVDWSWQGLPVEEPLGLAVRSFPDPAWAGAIEGAVGVWNHEGGAQVAYGVSGPLLVADTRHEGLSVVRYQVEPADGVGVLAQASLWDDAGALVECDIVFYGTFAGGEPVPWSLAPDGAAPGEWDAERVAIHEVGHCLGLGHPTASDAVMRAVQPDGTGPAARHLGADDIEGVQALYGVAEGPVLALEGTQVLDEGGDGVVEPGEQVDLVVEVANTGTASAHEVSGTLSTESPVTITDGADDWGTVLAGDVVAGSGFSLQIPEDCEGDYAVDLGLVLSDPAGVLLDSGLTLIVDCDLPPRPRLEIGTVTWDDDRHGGSLGNGDGVVQLGEAIDVRVQVANAGDAAATGVVAHLGSEAPSVAVDPDTDPLGALHARSSSDALFTVHLGSTCPGEVAPLVIAVEADGEDPLEVPLDLPVSCTEPAEPLLALGAPDPPAPALSPGDTWRFDVPVTNQGDGTSTGLQASLRVVAGDLDLPVAAASWPELAPGATVTGSFAVASAGPCGEDFEGQVRLRVEDTVGYRVQDTWTVPVVCDPDADDDGHPRSVDCDDGDPGVHPGATETCDGVDEDCDGHVDEDAVDATTYYPDGDGDGYGRTLGAVQACEQPSGHAARGGDCDDGRAAVHPGAIETCDGLDNDCDGLVDPPSSIDAGTWYVDSDRDGYGTGAPIADCEAPPGTAATPGDCDDSEAAAHPGADEVCDGIDNDCDGTVDEGLRSTWYVDADGDGHGDPQQPVTACAQPPGTAAAPDDCDDGDPDRHADCPPPAGRACASLPGGGSLAWGLVALVVACRRRARTPRDL